MKLAPFRMLISEIRKTNQGTFIEGTVEQGVLHEGDSIRYGRSINTIKFMKTKSAEKDDDVITMVHIRYFSDEYAPSDKHRITHRDSVRLFIPILNIPPDYFEGVEEIHYVNRNYFNMIIEDRFYTEIYGGYVVVVGQVATGRLNKGDHIKLMGDGREDIIAIASILDSGFNRHEFAETGDNMGIFMKDVTLDEVKGMTFATTEGLNE
jgi:GTPase